MAILTGLSGREIAFGSIVLPNDERVVGPVAVFVDDQFVGAGLRRIDNIPAGERQVVVFRSASSGENALVLNSRVRIDADTAVTLSYPDSLEPAVGLPGAGPAPQPRIVSARELPSSPSAAQPAARSDWLTRGLPPEPALLDRSNPIGTLVTGMPDGVTPRLWDRQMLRGFSLPWHQPAVAWQVDGDPDEWPWYVPAGAMSQTNQHPEIQVLSYRFSRSADDVLFLIEFNEAGGAFLRERDPRVKFQIQAGRTYRFQILKEDNGRWIVEGRAPSLSTNFEQIMRARAAASGSFLEIRVPRSFLEAPDSLSFMAVELERGNPNGPNEDVLSVPRSSSGELLWGEP